AVRSSFAGRIRVRFTDWERDAWKDGIVELPPGAIVLVEGCFLLARGAAGDFDLSHSLDLPPEAGVPPRFRSPPARERDGDRGGVGERYENRYIPGQRLHLELDCPRERADLVLLLSRPSER